MRVIVIGSGIVGASAAYQLVKRNHDVVLIDNARKGAATDAGAGIVSPWVTQRGEDWYHIARRGALFYPDLLANLEEDGENSEGYKKVGALCVSSNPEELDELERLVRAKSEKASEIGNIQRLSSKDARKLFPPLHEDLQAVFLSGAARVDGRMLRDAMIRAAKRHKLRLVGGEASLIKEANSIVGVKVKEKVIYADRVIIAAGAWVPNLLKPIGVDIKVEPQRGQIVHITLPNTDTSNWPIILPQSNHYMLAFDDSRIVAGATRETGSGFSYQITAGGVHEVLSEALRVAPGLADGQLKEVRIGFRPMGPDILPLLGTLDNFSEVIVATGLGASGLTMGPFIGSLAADLAQGLDFDIDQSIFKPERNII